MVVTVSHTAVATVAAIEMVGATPMLIDIEPRYYTMDPDELARVLKAHGQHIKAVIPVHLYGQPADLIDIATICGLHDVWCIEDCSQAHGATAGGYNVGSFGNLATFSFYPTKNLGAIGDGGMVVTNDIELDSELRVLRQYGWTNEARISCRPGINSRLDEMQAAILRVKLKKLDDNNDLRLNIAALYDHALPAFMWPKKRGDHVYHQYVIRHTQRDLIRARLADAGVATAVHYPVPVHLQPAYKGRVAIGPSRCHETELAAQQILSLPMWPEMSHEQIQTVCNALSLATRDCVMIRNIALLVTSLCSCSPALEATRPAPVDLAQFHTGEPRGAILNLSERHRAEAPRSATNHVITTESTLEDTATLAKAPSQPEKWWLTYSR